MSKCFHFSVWGGARVRRGTLTPANTYTDGSIFFTSDADSEFPHAKSKTRESDMAYMLNHGITDTCPSLKIYNNTDELRVNVNGASQNNVKLLMSCHCKLRFTMFLKSPSIIQNSLFFF